MTGADSHTWTGVYALDALTDDERAEVEAHLAGCPTCAAEIEEFRATVARMGLAVAETPPEHLRERVLAEIRAVHQERPSAAVLPPARPRSARSPRFAVAASVVALLAAAVFGWLTVRTQHELTETRHAQADTQRVLAETQQRYATLAALVAAPDTRSVSGPAGHTGGTATLLVSRRLGEAVVLLTGVPGPPAGHSYQAWLIDGTGPRSVGLVPTGASRSEPLTLAVGSGDRTFAVTVEPAGGSTRPTSDPVMQMDLPS
jgi:anti-sigma-K factor RskA